MFNKKFNISKSSLVVILFGTCGSAAYAGGTNIQAVVKTNGLPSGATGVYSSFRVANGGSTSNHRLCLSLNMSDGSQRAAYWNRGDTTMSLLNIPTGETYATAKAGLYSGDIAGDTDGNGHAVFPAYWPSTNPQRFVSGFDSGVSWDINTNGYVVGKLLQSATEKPLRYKVSSGTAKTDFDTAGFTTGNEIRCINSSNDVGGSVGGFPAIWTVDAFDTYTLVKISDASDWSAYSGRTGYVVGITDDRNYAVGWMQPGTDPVSNPGQPFVYNISTGHIRFVGTKYGEPLQVSNSGATVEFVGNTPVPYVWTSAADPTDSANTYHGCVDDLAAFLDPDSPALGSTTMVTGENSAREFGGMNLGGLVYVTSSESSWYDPVPPEGEFSVGIGLGELVGQGVDLWPRQPDGEFARFQKAFVPTLTSPKIRLNLVWDVNKDLSPSGFALRVTGRMVNAGVFSEKLSFYDFSTSSYSTTETSTLGNLPQNMTT